MKHANVAIFIPHNGCPNQCSFCNQKSITGLATQPTPKDIENAIGIAISSLGEKSKDAEIAFFGGSFTAIDRDYMTELLSVAAAYVKSGEFAGIRISTRPDAIDDEILSILKKYGVTSIELGAQSMDDEVLMLNRRGHTSEDVKNASCLIKKYGFSLGLQMMTGLYGGNADKDYETGKSIAALSPDTVRIYPTVIMKSTYLGELYEQGKYQTLSFDATVDLCSRLLRLFSVNNIQVIRLGLHDTDTLHKDMIAGVWHPAFREICESHILLERCIEYIKNNGITQKNIEILVNNKTVSKMVGQKRSNIKKLAEMGYIVRVKKDNSVNVDDFVIRTCG